MTPLDPLNGLADDGASLVAPLVRSSVPRRTHFADFRLVERIIDEVGPALGELAGRVGQGARGDRGGLVLLTGTQRGTGCSTVALALAAVAAREQSVLLIDGDLRSRGLSLRLADAVPVGWDDVHRDGFPLEEAVRSMEPPPGFAFLPLRAGVADPMAFLAQPALSAWQEQIRADYDLILVDGGSVWTSGTAWAPWVEAALMVCDSNRQLAEDWALSWDQLEEGGATVLGIVETFT